MSSAGVANYVAQHNARTARTFRDLQAQPLFESGTHPTPSNTPVDGVEQFVITFSPAYVAGLPTAATANCSDNLVSDRSSQ